MLVEITLIVTAAKLFFMPLYRSTDFEVHRNWLAVTNNRTIDQWYYDETSEWTLDYPPFFAWLEYGLSHIAKVFDPEMVKLENLNYASDMTVLFQRLSVIVLDFVFIYGTKSCSQLLNEGNLLVFILLVTNPGLLMVDHIHFQYNGFLFGILLLSISNMITSNFIATAFWFAVLLNFKHIFLYVAPVYVVYMLRAYCFTVSSNDGVHTPWYSFSLTNLIKLALTVISVFCLSFGPFIDQLPQVFSRLFPFKRGLCHAYWAPNFWALYNIADKILQKLCLKFGIPVAITEASMTGGLVQEFEHAVLPTITPSIAFAITAISMIPALIKLWHLGADRGYRCLSFVRCLTLCATCAFMFGWHVHEKAILMILIPLSFLSVLGDIDCNLFLFISVVGNYSLFPLLYPKNLLSIKIFILLTHIAIAFCYIPALYELIRIKPHKKRGFMILPGLKRFQSLYLYGFMAVCIYENSIHTFLGFDKTLPFLPLMITSVYCALGVCYFWFYYYYYFLTFNLSRVPTLMTSRSAQYEKKVT
ncbi:probable dolichyl pyrophosphate Glc1Man9GlcNAc2 alpha-1,3-glucosyltransferase [Vanessa tameamea]|uniref:Alpha-1,3-glucosyltransferase n=1 Tax=Vanessa tameamea TaxID=334116 RepID=A0A8B8I2P9_VANTA|nr:probable dolichyl pyrophosphate Glc1Man9GlcNAc2 alpha-1,3-glucosyltransferase [Vanessa tameamea]